MYTSEPTSNKPFKPTVFLCAGSFRFSPNILLVEHILHPTSLAVASYLKALENLKKAEQAVEQMKNHAAENNHELPKAEEQLKTAQETAQKVESQQQKKGAELSQKDLDTLHAAIDKAYQTAKEQGLIKDPLDLGKVRMQQAETASQSVCWFFCQSNSQYFWRRLYLVCGSNWA